MNAVAALAPGSGLIAAACTALGLSRASLHRHQAFRRQPLAAVRQRPTPMRALVAKERQVVLDLLREPRFVDLAPAEVYASLLDQGVYLCSIRNVPSPTTSHPHNPPSINLTSPTQSFLHNIPLPPPRSSPGASPMLKAPRCSNPCSTTPSSSIMSPPANSLCMPTAAAR